MVAEGLGRGPAPKARAEGALENFGLFGVRNRVNGPKFSRALRAGIKEAITCYFWHPGRSSNNTRGCLPVRVFQWGV